MIDFSLIPNTAGFFPNVRAVDMVPEKPGTGTPLDSRWVSAIFRALQVALDECGATPNGTNTGAQLVAALNSRFSTQDHNHDSTYSAIDHDHAGVYAVLAHNHSGVYSPASHNHDSTYSASAHNHDGLYSPYVHDHDSTYSAAVHNHDSTYSAIGHNHTGVYSALAHDHSGVYAALAHGHTGGTTQVISGNGSVSNDSIQEDQFIIEDTAATITIAAGMREDGKIFTVKHSGSGSTITLDAGVGATFGDSGSRYYEFTRSKASVTFAYESSTSKYWLIASV